MTSTVQRLKQMEDKLPVVEAKLFETFRPVKPDQAFVHDLQHRLMHKPEIYLSPSNNTILHYLLILLASVFSVVILAVLITKFSYFLVKILNKVGGVKNQA
jgi:hypothetical protein